jgi:hypothetical protein
MLARACERYAFNSSGLLACDAIGLASVGFGEKLFRDSPLWLKCYCAQVIEFIKHERVLLPQCCTDSVVSEEEADGVYGLRLQNLAITVDCVLSFLRRHPNHLLAPLQPYTDAEVAQKLVFDKSSIWSKFKENVARWRRSNSNTGLQKTLEGISERCGQKTPSIEAASDVLRSTATALRMEGSTYHPVAAVLEVQPFSLSMVLLFFIVHSWGHSNANTAGLGGHQDVLSPGSIRPRCSRSAAAQRKRFRDWLKIATGLCQAARRGASAVALLCYGTADVLGSPAAAQERRLVLSRRR